MTDDKLTRLVKAHQNALFQFVRYLGATAADAEEILPRNPERPSPQLP